MIKYVKGNILESDAEALVNPVNCVGVFDNRDKAKDVAKRHFKNCDIFDISFFRITECELNEITDISQEYIC